MSFNMIRLRVILIGYVGTVGQASSGTRAGRVNLSAGLAALDPPYMTLFLCPVRAEAEGVKRADRDQQQAPPDVGVVLE